MTQLSRFDTTTLSRALIGFDRMFDEIDRLHSFTRPDNYPPHNVIKTGENTYVIEMAVAGFAKDEISIQIENSQLTISGQKAVTVTSGDQAEPVYLHRGLASREFVKIFSLAEHIEVGDAELTNGILSVKLTHVIPEALKPRFISIKD